MDIIKLGEFGLYERVGRFVLSVGLIAAVLQYSVPPWVALIAVYPFFTALLAWDPLYSTVHALFNKAGSKAPDLSLAEEN